MAVAQPSAEMQLYFRGEKLADKDTFSKSDPYCVCYAQMQGARGPQWVEVGRTEKIDDNLNPVFQKPINVQFFFELKQEFKVVIYDDDGQKDDSKNDKLGEVDFTLSKVVSSRRHTAEFTLQPQGKLIITAVEAATNGKDLVELAFSGRRMKKMDTFGSADPYFKLYRLLPNGQRTLLFQAKHIDNTLDPVWPGLPRFRLDQLAGSDLHAKSLEFECYDKDTFSDDPMGSFQCSFHDLLNSAHDNEQGFVLLGKKNKKYGEVYARSCRVIHIPTFAEYLRGGFEINLAVSIDFTGSNGNPTDPRSLHFMNPQQPNHYVRAIMSVADILMEYDNDKMSPAFGFGALLPNTRATSHFFHLNLTENPYVHGVQGILDAYSACLPVVKLSGPTNFAPTIAAVTQGARQAPNVYTVLLILTDGEITDMNQTIDALVDADDAPLSIVIVGVGYGCDFEAMDQLDGDDSKLRHSRGRVSRRDLVQYVPFKKFERAPPHLLAAEVLREVPEQFVQWARLAKIDPPQEEAPPANNQQFQPAMQRGTSWVNCGEEFQ